VLSKPHDGRSGQSKPTAHNRYENNTCLRRKGALKVMGRSDPVETCMSLAGMKAFSSEQTDLLILLGLITTFFVWTQDRREHTAIQKPVTLTVYVKTLLTSILLWTPIVEAHGCYTASSFLNAFFQVFCNKSQPYF